MLSHATNDFMPAEAVRGIAAADRATRVNFAIRTRVQIAAFADGLKLIEPGIVSTAEWRPEPSEHPRPARKDTTGWCLLARKAPHRLTQHGRAARLERCGTRATG